MNKSHIACLFTLFRYSHFVPRVEEPEDLQRKLLQHNKDMRVQNKQKSNYNQWQSRLIQEQLGAASMDLHDKFSYCTHSPSMQIENPI